MPDGTGQFTWRCASCGRTVPQSVTHCRCGAARPPSSPDPSPPEAVSEPPQRSTTGIVFGFGAALIAVIVVVSFLLRPRPTSVRSEQPNAFPSTSSAGQLQTSASTSSPEIVPAAPPAPPASFGPAASPPAIGEPERSREDVINAAMPAVVSIEGGTIRGTGFFVARDLVVTNQHVVAGSSSVTIRPPRGDPINAYVATVHPEIDLALVRVAGSNQPQPLLPLASVSDIRVGEEVIAIGSPRGFQATVTRGIVSALRNAGGIVYVQTDAAINPGNSGGPLINRKGQVIAVNTLKFSGAESLAFAIGADHVKDLMSGRVAPMAAARPPAGVGMLQVPERKTQFEVAQEQGALEFETAVQSLARRADQVDRYWQQYSAGCVAKTSGGGGLSREWFGYVGRSPSINSADPECRAWWAEVQRIVEQIRAGVQDAEERARRASVLPGTVRDVRTRYRLDWSGLDR